MTLELETRTTQDQSEFAPGMMLTPPVGAEGYWSYRVRLSGKQAVIGFPKFGTIGIGFAEEEDWNTNLPYSVDTEQIFSHIKHNKGDDTIPDADVREAISMIQQAARRDRGK